MRDIALCFSDLETRQPIWVARDNYLVLGKHILFIYNTSIESSELCWFPKCLHLESVHDIHKIGKT
jgi:hypothetical protein